MKTTLSCLSILALGISAIALPLTAANDVKRTAAKNVQRSNTGLGLLAQSGRKDRTNKKTDNARESGPQKSSKATSAAKAKRLAPVTPEMEADVKAFVKQHHRALLDVLANLKAGYPKEYERAMRDLNRNRLRLKQLEGRNRYAAELELWKAQSRARMLSAKVQMGDSPELRVALRKTLAEIYDLRAKIVEGERDRTAERLKRLDEQVESLRAEREASLEKQLLALTKPQKKNKDKSKEVKTSARTKPSSKKTPNKISSGKTKG